MEPGSGSPNPGTYRGRFAPSPTGPLHFGSLVAATASYLQALTRQGQWLLRIEDLDPPRELAGAVESIIRSLESHAFQWDGPVHRQSAHLADYHAVADQLLADGLAYRCTCTREQIRRTASTGPTGPVYPGTCRNLDHASDPQTPAALRLKTGHSRISFDDRLQGHICRDVTESIGDFILRRKDGLIAYNLAAVIDDARQEITEVVRGCDLLEITPAQIELQRVLGLPTPAYMHVPVVNNERGQKLSKQTGATSIDERPPGNNLIAALVFLQQDPPAQLASEDMETIWNWASANWQPEKLVAKRQIRPLQFQ